MVSNEQSRFVRPFPPLTLAVTALAHAAADSPSGGMRLALLLAALRLRAEASVAIKSPMADAKEVEKHNRSLPKVHSCCRSRAPACPLLPPEREVGAEFPPREARWFPQSWGGEAVAERGAPGET